MGYLEAAQAICARFNGSKKHIAERGCGISGESGNNPPPAPSWPGLAAQRWGPGLEDDAPGIVIDRPDRERMLDALHAAALDPDPYELEERAAIRAESADPLDRLVGPRISPWHTLVWSDPDEPSIEAFGEAP